jgi:hypothetical protein
MPARQPAGQNPVLAQALTFRGALMRALVTRAKCRFAEKSCINRLIALWRERLAPVAVGPSVPGSLPQSSGCSSAARTRSAVLRAPSLRMASARWLSKVRGLICIRKAPCLLE